MDRAPSCLAALVVALSCFWLPDYAEANQGPNARFHFRRATAAFAQGEYEDALEHFLAVQRLVSSVGTTRNIALCYRKLGRDKEEFFYLSKFVRDSAEDPIRASARASAQERLQTLRARVAQVRIVTDPPGAEVFIDRKALGSYGVTPLALALEPGRRQVWIRKPGYLEEEVRVQAARGTTVNRSIALRRIEGRLKVRSAPSGNVVITNQTGGTVASGQSPLDVYLPPGVYIVEAVASGHLTRKEVTRVSENKDAKVELALEPLPTPKAVVNVSTTPPGAVVYIDGEPVAPTPFVLREVEPGQREFRIETNGYQSFAQRFDVQPSSYTLSVSLEKPPKVERSPATWIMGAVGLSALAAATVTGVLAANAESEFNRKLMDPDGSDISQLRDQGQALATTTDGLLIGGIISLGIGVVLYFTTEGSSDRKSRGYLTELNRSATDLGAPTKAENPSR